MGVDTGFAGKVVRIDVIVNTTQPGVHRAKSELVNSDALQSCSDSLVLQNSASGNKPKALSGLIYPATEQNLLSVVNYEQIDRDKRGGLNNLQEALSSEFHAARVHTANYSGKPSRR